MKLGMKREDAYVLCIDLGTGGPKVGFVSFVGHLAWYANALVETHHSDGGAGATQDASQWWDLIVEATRKGLAESDVDGSQVVAVSITGQWASTVPVDGRGLPVSDCVMWMDRRGARHSHKVVGGPAVGYSPRALATWVRRSGGIPANTGDDPVGHMLYLERDRPEVAAKARWYMEPIDYLAMRFTGVAAATPASMTGAWLVNTRTMGEPHPDQNPGRTRGPLEYDPVLVAMSEVNVDKLPPLRRTGSVTGTVMADVSGALGIAPGAKVVSSLPDIHTAAVGAGAVLDHQTHMAISTTAWISCPVPEKKTDVIRQIATIPGLTPKGYLVANNQEMAGGALAWLRNEILAESPGEQPSFEEICDLAATAAPGAGGVIFTPWLKGERSPVDDRNARAGWHNISTHTTRADLVRAVLEGVAYNSRWLLAAVDNFTNKRLDPIRLIGGGAQSDVWCQIIADVTDRRIERVISPLHANLRGAGLWAGMVLDAVAPHEVSDLAHVDRAFQPMHANRVVYDRLYAEFPRLYKANKSIFSRLNNLH